MGAQRPFGRGADEVWAEGPNGQGLGSNAHRVTHFTAKALRKSDKAYVTLIELRKNYTTSPRSGLVV